jgi:hypothetical protein
MSAEPTTTTAAADKPSRFRAALGRSAPVALAAIALPVSGSVATVAAAPLIGPWLREQGWLGVGLFLAAYITLGAFALAPT